MHLMLKCNSKLIYVTHICLSQTTLSFQGNFCLQSERLAMDFPFSLILANSFVHYFQNTLFKKISFTVWMHYNDDTFT